MPQDESTKTVSTNSEPWSGQKPYLLSGFQRADDLYKQGPAEYYPGRTVADTPAATTTGQQWGVSQAGANSNLIARTVGGEFLDAGNPHFQGMLAQIGQGIRPVIDSAFAANGRLGSGAHANAFASAMGDVAGKLAYQNYGDERARQIAASQDYSPVAALTGIGQQQEGKDQQYIQDSLNRWNFAQQAPNDALKQYMTAVAGGNFGQSSTSQQPYTSNPALQMIGTTLGGLGALGQGLPGLLSLFK